MARALLAITAGSALGVAGCAATGSTNEFHREHPDIDTAEHENFDTSKHPEYPDINALPASDLSPTRVENRLDPISAGAILSPISATIDSGGPGFGSINDTFNHSGLTSEFTSGVTNFDTYLATIPRHTMIFSGFEWFSNFGTTSATVTYDLGAAIVIDRMALWNEETSGIGTLNLLSSNDGVIFTPLASGLHPSDNPLTSPIDSPPYTADVFAFAPTSARFVRVIASDSPQPNPGSFPSAAIGEIAFRVGSLPLEYTRRSILGQPQPTETQFNRVAGNRGFHLGGVHVHRYKGRAREAMYVYDSGNNRILGSLNPTVCLPRIPGSFECRDILLGQSELGLGACNHDNTRITQPTASTLCLNRGPYAVSQEEEPRFSSMDTDDDGNLYVLDQYNNRVLRFNDPFSSDTSLGKGDAVADDVWGQPDMTSNECNRGLSSPDSDTLCTSRNVFSSTDDFLGGSVDIDRDGNLWVADAVNNRVLQFPFDRTLGAPAKSATFVIGQRDFISTANGLDACDHTPQGLCQAYVVQVDPGPRGDVYIIHGDLATAADPTSGPNYRISKFSPVKERGRVIGYDKAADWLKRPTTPGPGDVYLTNSRGLAFVDKNTFVVNDIQNGQPDRLIFMNTSGAVEQVITSANVSPAGSITMQELTGGMSVVDNILYLVEQREHNSVLRLNIADRSTGTVSRAGEFFAGDHLVWNTVTQDSLASPFGMAISKAGRQLFVSTGYRILVWNLPVSGFVAQDAPADFVIGQSDFFHNLPDTSNVFKDKVNGLAVDEGGSRLWVARRQEVYGFPLPISANINAVPTIAMTSRADDDPATFPGNVKWADTNVENVSFTATALAYDTNRGMLWIADSDRSRVLGVKEPDTNPTVNLVIGQIDRRNYLCNRGRDLLDSRFFQAPTSQTLCNPSSVAVVPGGELFIAEGPYEGLADRPGNKRIVEYDPSTINAALSSTSHPWSQPAADRVYAIGQIASGSGPFTVNPTFDRGFACQTALPCHPISATIDAHGRMIVLVDAYASSNIQAHRIYVYTDPLKTSTNGYVPFDITTGDVIVPEFMGQGSFSALDGAGNVYVQDHTWNRVLVFEPNLP